MQRCKLEQKSNSIAGTSPTMVGQNFEIHYAQKAKDVLKSSTMVGENFEIHYAQEA